jgi:hypothetical protein
MPQTLSTLPRFDTGWSVLEVELGGERAAALGRMGRNLERALAALAAVDRSAPDRPLLLKAAADATWRYFVQREAFGLLNHARPIADYGIPREVLARVGAG